MSLTTQARHLAKISQLNRKTELPDDIDAIIGYSPRPLQAEMSEKERRFNVEVLHRRFGKTVMKIRKLITRAVECPFDEGRYAYLAPTYAAAEDIAWVYLETYAKRLYDHLGLSHDKWIDKSKLAVWVPTRNGSRARIRLYGVDSPKQRLRGLYLDGVVFDEFAWIPWSVWAQQVRPMLADDVRQGEDIAGRPNQWADFIFTPFGRNHAHTMFSRAKIWFEGGAVVDKNEVTGEEERTYRNDWACFLYRASDTGIINRMELADALRDMGQSKYDQEFECSFDAAVEGAIWAREVEKLRTGGRILSIPITPHLPVNTAWDLGWDSATAIWFFQVHRGEVRFVDYYEASGAGLEHYADILAEKDYTYGRHYFPHDVEVGELGTGKSRKSILQQLGLRVTTNKKRPNKDDSIEMARVFFARCYFDDSRCMEGLDRLALYRRKYDEKNQVFRVKPLGDWASHGADAFIEAAAGTRADNMFSNPEAGRPPVSEM